MRSERLARQGKIERARGREKERKRRAKGGWEREMERWGLRQDREIESA